MTTHQRKPADTGLEIAQPVASIIDEQAAAALRARGWRIRTTYTKGTVTTIGERKPRKERTA